jgi:MATE family multidrug resistance protein
MHKAMREYLGPMLLLAGPIVVSQYAYLASGLADTVMSGRLGTVYQAGVAVGAAVWMPVQMFITGVLYGVMIVLSQYFGGGRPQELVATARQGLWLSLILGCAGAGSLYLAAPHLTFLGVTPDVAEKGGTYLRHLVWGLPFSSLAVGMRFYCDAQKNVVPATIVSIIAVVINIVLNYGLMFGKLGLPSMDVAGCGLATGISMALSAGMLGAYVSLSPRYHGKRLLAVITRPSAASLGALTFTGLPIGVALVSEFLLMSVIAICISSRGAVAIASHQIAFNFMMILFALPTSVSMATSIMVGNEHGGGRREGEQGVVLTSIAAGTALGLVLTVLMWAGAGPVAAMYSHDRAVIDLATGLLLAAALFQLMDAVQICLNGALRGIEDTVAPFLISSGIYWLIALPLGYALAGMPLPFGLREIVPDYGVIGWWFALVFGITLVALALARRVTRRFFAIRTPVPTGGDAAPDRKPAHTLAP